ncbi:MAG: hypothetical protein HZB12_02510 [Candidatus Yonathbacteria bacterium]|nr:hypothetical protein [Candidatus Yonathbacteria bacterium]
MDSIFEHYKKTGYLHHAHVIEGIHDELAPALVLALAKHLGIETQSNPDLTVAYHESLGIDEARWLKEVQTRTAFGGTRKIFIVGANSFTREAQNALLKTFEEPTADTHFFIILPHAEMLLPTLRSRVLVVLSGFTHEDETKKLAEKFLDSTLEGRFTIAKKLAEKKAGEVVDRELFRRMLDHIERILYTRTAGNKDEKIADIFREIFQAKTYLTDRGSSPKMLMEHIAIVLPFC